MRRLLALAAVVAIGVVAMPAGADGGAPPQPELEDHAVRVGDDVAPEERAAEADEDGVSGVEFDEVQVDDDVGLVGLKWDGEEDAEFRILVQNTDGIWEELDDVESEDSAPDPGTQDDVHAEEHRGADFVSEPILVNEPSTVRVEVLEGHATNVRVATATAPVGGNDHAIDGGEATESSAVPRTVVIVTLAGLAVALMLPANRRRLTTTASMLAVVMAFAVVAAACTPPPGATPTSPPIVSRAGWGANESMRNCGPSYAPVRLAVVHHTVNGNSYTQAQAPGIVRSIYHWHTVNNGWCDIGYNFLVDRFGRVYEGRFGGTRSGVVGAHAAGFNTGSVGIASIGNHNTAAPTAGTVNSIIALLRWQLSIHNVNPYAAVHMNGRSLPPIIGHRDVNATSCPGTHLYSRLPGIRNAVNPHVTSSRPFGRFDSLSRQGSQVTVRGWGIHPTTSAHVPVHVYVGGPAGVGRGYAITANTWRPDVGAAYPQWGNNRGFQVQVPIQGPRNQVCAYLINGGRGGNTFLGCRSFSVPFGNFDSLSREGSNLRVRGWGIDPGTSAHIPVHVYVGGPAGVGHGVATTANVWRPDVGAVHPGWGNHRGFEIVTPIRGPRNQVCAYLIIAGAGPHTFLGCRGF